MSDVYLCDFIRTPIGRFGGTLASMRPDDLGAVVLKALMGRHPDLDFEAIDEVVFGCANQAGEDNRNVARMSLLLAGVPISVPGTTINRLCGSGMDAIIAGARAIRSGEANLVIAGGVESMSRAPFVVPKAESAYSRSAMIEDTTIGWRLINPLMKAQYGVDSMPETAENVAEEFGISRQDQDRFACRSQTKALAAQANGRLGQEIVPVEIRQRKGQTVEFTQDEHPRSTTLDALAALKAPFRDGGSVTAGNASGVNDGAAAVILASDDAIKRHGLTPLVRILGGAAAGVAPRIMGMGPVPALRKLMTRLDLQQTAFDVIELNEAFASQGLACLRELDIADDDPRVNPNGGAIALGHPLGMSGVRITGTAALELAKTRGQYAAATMCIGVGQGIAVAMERV
ncbi:MULTISPECIES: 3-oxoadipyl-CoA thiolase [Agrobacterium]|uniref:Beta-ketoadipyl-CoA thiolase n=1 Tax=Agrobacterium tumefaciens TaxID=358 RepID=A0AAF0H295_AGRTU|nr:MULTISPECIES: 3-oxoadipyl-CoA thiolase [Agrobacterium]WGM61095.1 3-oxoadipyl-CoA thiolase [Agrobacterium tumefaciens]CVI62964.1 putative acetyl-CoA acetyltransferase (phbA/atoB/paaJ-like) [Agrobacterium salinitolerans str. Hayward 0363]